MAGQGRSLKTKRAGFAGPFRVLSRERSDALKGVNGETLAFPRYLVWGKPRSTWLVAGSGQRLVTTLPRV